MYAFLRGFLAVEKRVFFAVKHVFFSKVAILYVSGEGEVTNHCIFTCSYELQGAKMTENLQKWLFCCRVVKVR